MTVDQILIALRRAAANDYPWSVSPQEASALVAEVARLRAEVDTERAAVVAWLEKAGWMPSMVEVFKRGEHRREEEP